jgi:hypothetical protein
MQISASPRLGEGPLSKGIFVSAPSAVSSWDVAFDFRNTLGYVTDPSYAQFVGATVTYPTTNTINGQSVQYGWVATTHLGGANRSTTYPRLAGTNFNNNTAGVPSVFRVNTPAAGTYIIHLALGDATNAIATLTAQGYDTATSLFAFSNVSVASGSFIDPNGTILTAANWVAASAAGGTPLTVTTATTEFLLSMGPITAGTGTSPVAYLRLTKVP